MNSKTVEGVREREYEVACAIGKNNSVADKETSIMPRESK